MVAKITFPKRVQAALRYNENKVQKGAAVCLAASGYLREGSAMNFYQKLTRFESLHALNERATTKTIHVSLNFDPSEKLADRMLTAIAARYMTGIGFGEQPYLVYRHEDAGHPHIHIVSTTILADGSRMNTHNIGRNQSEKTRQEIEQHFGLMKAQRQKQLTDSSPKPVDVKKVVYGTQETKQSISNVVGLVFSQYKFTSLPEFNAVLSQFNVLADRGKADGRIFKQGGLVYRILDEQGNKVGVPIKASSLSSQPTLSNLERKFTANKILRDAFQLRTKNKVDSCLSLPPRTMNNLIDALAKQNIATVLRKNEEGRVYGITFVDHTTRCVFNGSDLGKGYSAAAIQGRLAQMELFVVKQKDDKGKSARGVGSKTSPRKKPEKAVGHSTTNQHLLDALLPAQEQYSNIPFQLRKKKKRKKGPQPNS